jgi:hypothetical protein
MQTTTVTRPDSEMTVTPCSPQAAARPGGVRVTDSEIRRVRGYGIIMAWKSQQPAATVDHCRLGNRLQQSWCRYSV